MDVTRKSNPAFTHLPQISSPPVTDTSLVPKTVHASLDFVCSLSSHLRLFSIFLGREMSKSKPSSSKSSSYLPPRTTRASASRYAKEIPSSSTARETESLIEDDISSKLPNRLFSVDHYPSSRRLNIYSTPEYLGVLVHSLRGTVALETLLNSQFGHLFKLPISRCAHSGKLIHSLLIRQLVTSKLNELWFVFGGHPMRFSLREFHITTGLACQSLPSEEDIENHQDPSYLSVWNRLFGAKKVVYVSEVVDILRKDGKAADDEKLTPWKRLCLALIVLVDGVVVCSSNDGSVTNKYVEMLHDLDYFLAFPWGRLSFIETLGRLGPPKGVDHPLDDLRNRLQQSTSVCYGFPLALQLQALKSIPAICSKIKRSTDMRDFIEMGSLGNIGTTILLRSADVLLAETQTDLSVQWTLNPETTLNENDFLWVPEEVSDPKVDFMLKLIHEGHMFNQNEWVGGDSSLPSQRPQRPSIAATTSAGKSKKKKPSPIRQLRKGKQKACEHKNKGPSTSDNTVGTDESSLKDWVVEQNQKLRTNIVKDIKKMFEFYFKSSSKWNAESSRKRRRCPTEVELSSNLGDENTSNPHVPHMDSQRWEDYGDAFNITSDINRRHGEDILTPNEGSFVQAPNENVENVPHTSRVDEEGIHMEQQSAGVGSPNNPLMDEVVQDTPMSRTEDTTTPGNGINSVQEQDIHMEHQNFEPELVNNPVHAEMQSMESEPRPDAVDDDVEFDTPDIEVDDEVPGTPQSPSTLNVHIQHSSSPYTAIVAKASAYFVKETTYINQPLPKRVPKRSRYLEDEQFLADPRIKSLFGSRSKPKAYKIIPDPPSANDVQLFYSVLGEDRTRSFSIVTGHDVCNGMFIELSLKDVWIAVIYMQLLVALLVRKRCKYLMQNRCVILDPLFVQLISKSFGAFASSPDKSTFDWGRHVKAFVTGKSTGRHMKSCFIKDVDVVYVPMEWDCNYWTGLVIDFKKRNIMLINPFLEVFSDETIAIGLSPIANALPFIINKYIGSANLPLHEFSWTQERVMFEHQTEADSGAVIMKSFELHAQGVLPKDISVFNEDIITRIRIVYALDAYAEFVGGIDEDYF